MKIKSFSWKTVLFVSIVLFSSCHKDDDNDSPTTNTYRDVSFEEPQVTGNTFYIDPENGSSQGDGSKNNPWRTMQEVVENNKISFYQNTENYNPDSPLELVNPDAPVKGGDRLILLSGYHGHLSINRFIFEDWLTIEAAEGQTPVFSQINMTGAFRNVYLKNLTIIKSSYQGSENYWEADAVTHNTNACLHLQSSDFWGRGSDVKIYGLTLKTTGDVSGWSASDWVERSAGGISLRAVENIDIVNCTIENVRHGIAIEYFSDYTVCMNNTVKNFSGDGARIISNHVFFGYNTITDCYKVDDNHDDCIQSYSRGEDNSAGTGVLEDVTIRGNLLIGTTDFDNPLAGSPQGIGCFDGMFDGWTVENNVVITNHYHGISFYGMLNSKILNNTVIDQVPGDDVSPWIRIADHKNGTPSNNCLVANNIAMSSVSVSGENVEENNNLVIGKSNYAQLYEIFSDPDNFDLHLLSNEYTLTSCIDMGAIIEGAVSSEMDRDNTERSGLPDLGAYEYEP